MPESPSVPTLSVVVPVFNEQDNIAPLVAEITAALRGVVPFEIVYVDDASRDGTAAALVALKAGVPELRVVQHERQSGQSTAIRTGVKAARGAWIGMLDGDGQNDPADLAVLWREHLSAPDTVRLFAGWRTTRRDTWSKRWSSKIANAVRSRMLRDATPDTGCGLKLFDRAVFLDLPYFDHMHRYLPALVLRAGFEVRSVPVRHRPRTAGVSKYGMWNRLWVGLADLRGVAWLIRRSKRTAAREL